MTSGFGGQGYVAPSTRTLNAITQSPNPDASDYADAGKLAGIIQSQGYQIKALAEQTKQLQKGVDQATQNPIQQIQQFIADVIVLLGGGQLADGLLDFGDLQYILPTLGALFGLGDGPFPIDLFQAAEKFFLGYVVPSQQFADVINNMIGAWMTVFGIDPKFIKDVKALVTAFGTLFDEVGNLLPSLQELFDALGISGGDLGPLGQILGPIIKLFSSIDLAKFGTFIEFITDAIDPFIVQLTAVINFINAILAVIGFDGEGGVVNSPIPQLLAPFQNILKFLGNLNFGALDFDPIDAASQFVQTILSKTGLLLGPDSPFNLANAFGQLGLGQIGGVSIGDLTDAQPNQLPDDGAFLADSLAPSADWTTDTTNPRTAGRGCAVVVADGFWHALRSGRSPDDVIVLAQNQVFETTVWFSCDDYVGVGDDPILLQLVPFTNGIPGTPITLDSYAPTDSQIAWPGVQLTGKTTIPAGVTGGQVRYLVTDGALQGTLRFADANAVKTTLLQKSWMDGLEDDLQGISGQIQAAFDTIASAVSGIPIIGAGLADVANAIENFNPANIAGALGSINIAGDMQAIVNMLVGGLRGKPVTGNANLADIYTAASQTATNIPGSDVTTDRDTTGSFPINSWANWLDLAGVGRGQDGQSGAANPIPGFFGQGGHPGKWNATTWQRGVHFDSGVTAVNFTVNADGSITFSIPAGNATPPQTMTCLPGSGAQTPHLGGGWQGIGPSISVYNGGNFVGGETQNQPGADGLGPGGGGAGGLGILFQPGGKGAGPRGWVRQRANAVANQATGADTTPPSGGHGDFLGATLSSVRIGAHGSVDA